METIATPETCAPKLVCLLLSYNHADTLPEAIESVLMQKCDFAYKLVIMDDCSTDGSYEVAMEYQAKHPDKIQVVRNEVNLGLVPNTAKAYRYLKGVDYFCVIDCDDKYTYDKKFAEAVAYLEAHPDYTIYMTNVLIKSPDEENLCYKGNCKSLDLTYAERKQGKYVYIHTTGQTYRNIYFKDGDTSQFDRVLKMRYPDAYRSELHRFEWYLKKGKAHLDNHVQSIWNVHGSGIASSCTRQEKLIFQIQLFHSYGDEFFPEEREFYFSQARHIYQCLMNENADGKMPEGYMEKNRDALISMFNALFSKKALQNAALTNSNKSAAARLKLIQDFTDVIKYKKHYISYYKYKLFRILTIGKIQKFKEKEAYHHQKVRNARRTRREYLVKH